MVRLQTQIWEAERWFGFDPRKIGSFFDSTDNNNTVLHCCGFSGLCRLTLPAFSRVLSCDALKILAQRNCQNLSKDDIL